MIEEELEPDRVDLGYGGSEVLRRAAADWSDLVAQRRHGDEQRVVLVEHARTRGGVEAQQALAAQQVNALSATTAAATTALVLIQAQLTIVTQEANSVAQRHGVIEISLRLAFGVRVVDLKWAKIRILCIVARKLAHK